MIEERAQRWSTASADVAGSGLRLERRDATLDLPLAPPGSPASPRSSVFCATVCACSLFFSGTMYGASALDQRLLELREPAELAVRLARARAARVAAARRARVSGMNAFVHVSTAAVRVSMKFSSSGKGVPSP